MGFLLVDKLSRHFYSSSSSAGHDTSYSTFATCLMNEGPTFKGRSSLRLLNLWRRFHALLLVATLRRLKESLESFVQLVSIAGTST